MSNLGHDKQVVVMAPDSSSQQRSKTSITAHTKRFEASGSPTRQRQDAPTTVQDNEKAPSGRRMIARAANERETRLSLVQELENPLLRRQNQADIMPQQPPKSFFDWDDEDPPVEKTSSKVRAMLTSPFSSSSSSRARSRAADIADTASRQLAADTFAVRANEVTGKIQQQDLSSRGDLINLSALRQQRSAQEPRPEDLSPIANWPREWLYRPTESTSSSAQHAPPARVGRSQASTSPSEDARNHAQAYRALEEIAGQHESGQLETEDPVHVGNVLKRQSGEVDLPPVTPPVDCLFDRFDREGEALSRQRTRSSATTPSWLRSIFSKRARGSDVKTPRPKTSSKSTLRQSSSTSQLSQWMSPEGTSAQRSSQQLEEDVPPVPALPTASRAPKLKKMLSRVTLKGKAVVEDVFASVDQPSTLQAREFDMKSVGRIARRQFDDAYSPRIPASPYRPQNSSIHASSPRAPIMPIMGVMPVMSTVSHFQGRSGLESPTPLPRAQSYSALYEAARRAPHHITSVRQLREQSSHHDIVPRPEPLGMMSPSGLYVHIGAPRMVTHPADDGWTYTSRPPLETDLPHSDVADIDPERWERGVAYARAQVQQEQAEDRQRKKEAKRAAKQQAAEGTLHQATALRKLVGSRKDEVAVRKTAELVEWGSMYGMALLKPIEELTEEDFDYVARSDEQKGMEHLFSGSKNLDQDDELIDLDRAIMLDPGTTSSAGGGTAAEIVLSRGRDMFQSFDRSNTNNETPRQPASDNSNMSEHPDRERYDWQPDYSQPGAQHGAFGPYMAQVFERFGSVEPEVTEQRFDTTNTARTACLSEASTQPRQQTSIPLSPSKLGQRLTAERDPTDPSKFKLTPELRQRIEELKLQREAMSPSMLDHPGIRAIDVAEPEAPDPSKIMLQSQQALEYAAELPPFPVDDTLGMNLDPMATLVNRDAQAITTIASTVDKQTQHSLLFASPTSRSASCHANLLVEDREIERKHSPQTPRPKVNTTTFNTQTPTSVSSRSGLRPLILVERKLSRESETSSMSESALYRSHARGASADKTPSKVASHDLEDQDSPKSSIFIKAMSNAVGKRPVPAPLDFSEIPPRYGNTRVQTTQKSRGMQIISVEEDQPAQDMGAQPSVIPMSTRQSSVGTDGPQQSGFDSSSDDDQPQADLIKIVARMTVEDRAGRLNKEQKRNLAMRRRVLLGASPERQELQDQEIYELDQRLKYFDPRNRERAIEDRKRFSIDVDQVVADWKAAGPTLSHTEEGRLRQNMKTEAQLLRQEFALTPLAAPLPGEQKHPLHMFEKKAKKLMCRGKHNPAVELPQLPMIEPGKQVRWGDFAQYLFEDVAPTRVVPPVKCGVPWCNDYCCEYGKFLARSQFHTNDVVLRAGSIRAKEQAEALKARCPNGIEEFETFMQCVGCGAKICGRCTLICGVQLCQEICCHNCRDHKNNACPIHHPVIF